MTVNIVPYTLPPIRPRRQPFRRPWNIDPSCVLCLMPEVNTKWIDYSGKGNDGTITTATTVHNCRYGQGLSFDGVNDYVNCGNDASLNMTTAITIAAWVRTTNSGSQRGIVGKDATPGGTPLNYLFFRAATNFLKFSFYTGGWKEAAGTVTIHDGAWHHAAVTYDKANIIIYTDGVGEATAQAANMTINTKPVIIGARGEGPNSVFDGSIDEVCIYNRALVAWEIKALYEQGKPGGD